MVQRMSVTYRTGFRSVQGADRLRQAVDALIRHSTWFEVTPYPADRWEITVKAEALGQLDALLRRDESRDELKLLSAQTGRWSSAEPNVANVSKAPSPLVQLKTEKVAVVEKIADVLKLLEELKNGCETISQEEGVEAIIAATKTAADRAIAAFDHLETVFILSPTGRRLSEPNAQHVKPELSERLIRLLTYGRTQAASLDEQGRRLDEMIAAWPRMQEFFATQGFDLIVNAPRRDAVPIPEGHVRLDGETTLQEGDLYWSGVERVFGPVAPALYGVRVGASGYPLVVRPHAVPPAAEKPEGP